MRAVIWNEQYGFLWHSSNPLTSNSSRHDETIESTSHVFRTQTQAHFDQFIKEEEEEKDAPTAGDVYMDDKEIELLNKLYKRWLLCKENKRYFNK